ncbi:MAG: flagellar hook-basal body complex protein [Butyrivibrio sp.]|nr:flagellar hook-basal body complex protein [Butyrivibrio sp.]
MMRSLWSGVTGLKTHQLEMDVIGNNIANVNTTAYKGQATGFSDVLYQTVKNGTGAGNNRATTNTSQVGLGARVGSIYTSISTQGSAIGTGNVLDLMINGDSFFVAEVDGYNRFTRDGSLTIDEDGFLVTQNNGYYIKGVQNGEVTNAAPDRLQVINRRAIDWDGDGTNENLDYVLGEATSEAYFKGNIDKEDPNLEEGKNLSISVFGSDGNSYTLKFQLTDAGDDEDNTYKLSLSAIYDKDNNEVKNGADIDIDLVYDKHTGKLTSADGNTDGFVKLNFTGDAKNIGPINVNFGHTTNYAGSSSTHSSSIYGYKGNEEGLNQGYARGTLTGISIDSNGTIHGTYSNGQTIVKGQLAVAEFNNAMGLEKIGDNMYAASLNSGEPIYQDVYRTGGSISSGVLEGSNVNLAKEFTDMITTQRGFQANSKVITTSDEMLQLLKGLKR